MIRNDGSTHDGRLSQGTLSEQITDVSLKAEYFTKHYREEKATAEKGSAVCRSLELWTELTMK